jgi:ATP-dependent DNA ligase
MMPGPWCLSELDSMGLRFYLAAHVLAFASSACGLRPSVPSASKTPPSGKEWVHEIKHDGFRVIALKVGTRVKLYSRPGNDLTYHPGSFMGP